MSLMGAPCRQFDDELVALESLSTNAGSNEYYHRGGYIRQIEIIFKTLAPDKDLPAEEMWH